MTYQARAAARSLAHTALSIGCSAMLDVRGAAAHAAAATAWAALATFVAGAVKLGTPQWIFDAMWVEPAPIDSIDAEDDKPPRTYAIVYGEPFDAN